MVRQVVTPELAERAACGLACVQRLWPALATSAHRDRGEHAGNRRPAARRRRRSRAVNGPLGEGRRPIRKRAASTVRAQGRAGGAYGLGLRRGLGKDSPSTAVTTS